MKRKTPKTTATRRTSEIRDRLQRIGVIRSTLESRHNAPRQGDEGAPDAWLDVRAPFAKALEGISPGDEIVVLTWLHRSIRDVLQVHPRGEIERPLTGVFATRSPDRPNPIGLHPVTVRSIHGRRLRHLYAACAFAFCGLLACGADRPPQRPSGSSEVLVWQDEFDGAGLPDASRWNYEVGFIRNNERQYYTRDRLENARVENGLLVIEARRERYQNADYTSASLTSRANWTYARIEVRAKLPTGRGTWPAIWTLGTNIREVGWPECGEIDIMEHVGFDPGRIHANIHTKAYNHVQGTNKGNSVVVAAPDDSVHVYSMTWTADQIAVSVDGQQYFTFAKEPGGTAVWPFDRPQYLILNLAIGGSWGGQRGIDDSAFPTRYEIDYVRVFSRTSKVELQSSNFRL